MHSVKYLREDSPQLTPDYQTVEYRLNNRKRLSDTNSNSSRTFAVELSNGSMVRIVVSSNQAEQFERELSTAIQQNPKADIGNILYELTRFFDIYDVQWMGEFDDEAPIVEDDDLPPTQNVSGDQPNADVPDDQSVPSPPDETGSEGEAEDGNGGEDGMFDTNQSVDLDAIGDEDPDELDSLDANSPSLKDVLQTMISQLTADSEARKAEAEARKAEADAQKAQAVARAMELKVNQEKELQAMEDWESKEREKKNKSKEMDRLAKFRLAQAQGLTDSRKPEGSYLDNPIMVRGHLSEGYIPRRRRVSESAPAAPQMVKHLRGLATAIKSRPQTNPQAFDNVEDAALDIVSDVQAQRAQLNRDIAVARRGGESPEELRNEQQIANLRLEFTRRVAQLRSQLETRIGKVRGRPQQ